MKELVQQQIDQLYKQRNALVSMIDDINYNETCAISKKADIGMEIINIDNVINSSLDRLERMEQIKTTKK